MVAKTTKSTFAAKIGGKINKAITSHKDDDVDYGIIEMPPGVKQGVAQLTDCYFKEYETGDYKGKHFFRMAGCAIEPDTTPDGKQVAGLYTSLMIPCCDTKNSRGEVTTEDEHIAEVMNELKKMGADLKEVDDAQGLEAVAEVLKEAAPYFRFSTSLGKKTEQYPNPRTWENWHGNKGLEDYTPPETNDVDDKTGSNGKPKEATAKKNAAPAEAAKASTKKATPVKKEVTFAERMDALAEQADGGDKGAQTEIQEYALGIGVSEEDIAATANWTEVVDLIRTKEAEGSAEVEGEGADDNGEEIDYEALGTAADEEYNGDGEGEACAKLRELAGELSIDPDAYATWAELATAVTPGDDESAANEAPAVPAKSEVWYYQPKGAKKKIECEVVAVFEDKETANLKNLDDNKTLYKSVPFADMSST